MLHIKYAPKIVSQCVVNLNIVKDLSKYLNNTSENTVCVVHGNTGSGKTLTVNLILKDLKLHKTEINYTDKINKHYLFEKLETSQNTVVVFEDVQFYENDMITCINNYYKKRKSTKKIIIINENEFQPTNNTTYVSLQTKITNTKLYFNFIKNILKTEKIKKPGLLKHIEKYSNDIRSCLNFLENGSMCHEIKENNIINCIEKLSTICDLDKKLFLISNNFLNIQYLYYENIHLYNIDIKTRLKFSNAMIYCDTFNTLGYNSQNWEFLKYIPYISTIQSVNILHKPPKTLTKSTIWSSYSNLCSKANKINVLLTNSYFIHNYTLLKYVQSIIINYINNENIDDLKKICCEYNINKYEVLNDILQVGFIKKQNIKNIKLIKYINK